MEIEYLQVKNEILHNMSVEDFNSWKYIDQYGNVSSEVQFKDELRINLEKIERYDLLINLFDIGFLLKETK